MGSNGKFSATDGQPAAAWPPAPVYKMQGGGSGGGGEIHFWTLGDERPVSTASDVYHVLDRGADNQAAAPGVYQCPEPNAGMYLEVQDFSPTDTAKNRGTRKSGPVHYASPAAVYM